MGNTQINPMTTGKGTVVIKDGIVGVLVNANGTPVAFLSPDKSDAKKTNTLMLDGSAPPVVPDPTLKYIVLSGMRKVQTMSIKQTPLDSSITLFATGVDPQVISWKVLPQLIPGTVPAVTSGADTSAPASTVSVANVTYGIPVASIDVTCKTEEYLRNITLNYDTFNVLNKLVAVKFTSADSKTCSALSSFSIWYILLIILVCIAVSIIVYKNRNNIKVVLRL